MEALSFLAIVHVLIAIVLIVLVLLQDSKGGAMGMLGGGGGGNTVFGSTGAASFLTRATRWMAIAFAITCITLAYMTTRKDSSVLDEYVPATIAPLEGQQDPLPGAAEKSQPEADVQKPAEK